LSDQWDDTPSGPAATSARWTVTPSLWLLVCVLFATASTILFVYNGVRYSDETQSTIRTIPYLRYDIREDFNYFYAGAEMTWRGEAADLYPLPGEWTFYPRDPIFFEPRDDYANARLLARGNYYNPPALAYLQAPLTTLGFRDAYFVFTALSIGCLLGFVGVSWYQGRQMSELPWLILGVLAFKPVHEVIILGHTTMFIVLALTAGFLLLRAEKPVLAGLAFAVLALKPQWAVLPGLFLLVRGEWRALGTMAAAATTIFFVPFFVTGFQTLENYYHFLRYSADVDLKDAPHMFSWNGFLSKMDDSEVQNGQIVLFADAPSRLLVYSLIALTALPMLVVWWSRDYLLAVAATVVAMLLVSTHSVWYDWALLVVAALFLLLRSQQMGRGMRIETWIVLLALYVASSQSISEVLYPDRHDVDWHRAATYWITPVAFLSLYWMVSVAARERLLRLPSRLQRGRASRMPSSGASSGGQ
jgi:alpha-1,2-mannosyltransferase